MIKPFERNLCGLVVTSKISLNNYQSHVHGVEAKQVFSCSRCGRCLTTRSTLKRHQESKNGCKVDNKDHTLKKKEKPVLKEPTGMKTQSMKIEVLDKSILKDLKETILSLTNLEEAKKLSENKVQKSNKEIQKKRRFQESNTSPEITKSPLKKPRLDEKDLLKKRESRQLLGLSVQRRFQKDQRSFRRG